MLCINGVNSLEILTDVSIKYAYDPEGGYIECIVHNITQTGEIRDEKAEVLLDSLVLGLKSAKDNYGNIKLEFTALTGREFKFAGSNSIITFTR